MKPEPKRASIRLRLLLWNSLIVALLFAGLFLAAGGILHSKLVGNIDEQLERQVSGFVREHPNGTEIQKLKALPFGKGRLLRRSGGSPAISLSIYDTQGRPLFGLETPHPPIDLSAFRLAVAGTGSRTNATDHGTDVRVHYEPIMSDGKVQSVVQASYPLTEVADLMHSSYHAMLFLGPLAILLSICGGLLATRSALREIHTLNKDAKRIGPENLSERLPISGADEFAQLAVTMNGMLDRVESALNEQKRLLEAQKRFTADASHELRTPLTVIRGATSLALSREPKTLSTQEVKDVERAATSMAILIDDMLLLARSDSGHLGTKRISLILQEVLLEAADMVLAIHPCVCLDVCLEDPSLAVFGNETELVRLFCNLLDNAARYGRHVRVSAGTHGASMEVTIQDDGPGIDPEHLAHLGERFYRVDESRTESSGGTGLGLAICREIVEANGGQMGFESEVGNGLTVRVTLPTG